MKKKEVEKLLEELKLRISKLELLGRQSRCKHQYCFLKIEPDSWIAPTEVSEGYLTFLYVFECVSCHHIIYKTMLQLTKLEKRYIKSIGSLEKGEK
jgi:hypothetical protein